jgi:hypothetical protein
MRIPRPTYGGVTATIALITALGGTSYAAVTISGKDIRNGTVTSSDLKNESVKSRDIDNGSLTGSDLKNGSVTGSDIDDGSLQAKDFQAGQLPAGPPGPQGPAGATDVVTRRTDVTIADGTVEFAAATCLPGETAVGGGAGISGVLTGDAGVVLSEPVKDNGQLPASGERATRWRAAGLNATGGGLPQVMNVHVLCATP